MQPVIKLEKLTKSYGSARGVEDINLEVPEGTIFGFLGPNGAGKSTTINMLINLTKPTSGRIEIFGKDATEDGLEIRRRVGFLSSDLSLDGGLSGWQQIEYFGNLRGDYDKAHVQQLAKRLDCDLSRKIRNLSRGNRQKVALITALMHQPDLLVLDEPTSGLDPLIQAQFNEIILDHKNRGKSTFISSHVLSEIQELCDHVAFIRKGKLVASMTMDELETAAPKQVRVVSGDKKLASSLAKLSGVKDFGTKPDGAAVFAFTGDVGQLIGLLAKHKVTDLSIQNTDLESTFMSYYEADSGEVKNA